MTRFTRRAVLAATAAAPLRSVVRSTAETCLDTQSWLLPDGHGPHDVWPAADGVRVWYTAQRAGKLGLLEPLTGRVDDIDLGEGSRPHGVIVALDGSAWVTDGGRDEIQRVDPETFEVQRFPTGFAGGNLNTATFDGEGAHWFTGQAGILGRFDPLSGDMTVVEAPRGRGPYGIQTTTSGEVWFVSLAGGYLGRLSYGSRGIAVEEFEPPTRGSGPRRVWPDSQGALWVAQWNAGQVARFDPGTNAWNEWRLPGDAPQAYAVYVDEQDIVWLTDFGANAIVRFDPASEEFTSVTLPHPTGNVRQLAGRRGQIWGAESGAGHIVMIGTVCAGP